jgi:integrase
MEMQAAKRLRRRDVDLERHELHAQGSKTAWRNRTVAVTEGWAWPIIAAHVKPLLPNTLLFPDLDHSRALSAHHAACRALKLAPSTLHDHRHHYAVALRRRGVSDVVIAKQLGHGSTMLVATRYGRYQPDAAEVTRAAGNGARPAQKRGARRAK